MKVLILNAFFGLWLLVSAFLWPHSVPEFHNAWIIGLLATLLALAAIGGAPWARTYNYALALWLFLSTFLLPRAVGGTALNNVLVAAGLIVTSLLPEHLRSGRVREPLGSEA